ncbi:MAG: sulfatase-like hydrolase/transferase, partial [Bacteroidota bacterium]
MQSLNLLSILAFVVLMTYSCSSVQEAQDFQKPNIVFILADDIGQTQLGCYGGPYHTPNLDRFASQGMKFTNAY